ncbi:allantoin racemase [Pseudorhizobium tarimense]|uniref:Allantoin racemase n=1 Tax=Pseudorhizobium tarimense TaxID=1079109 RepID=A0ABV2H8L0_9HYPH|nr:aspartate/glutamate racemase family protein [Pseudorhizobium tarimense]MCJ8520012.1 aspartate/glutamate racemase family protein [Pseudorhizobium tarimense]
MRILIVNPNTTASMTERIAAAAEAVAASQTTLVPVTSTMGPASIEGYYDEALAVPGLLEAVRSGEREGAQAAIIACFDDTGLDAARCAAAIPVIGICEAAVATASFIAQRFTVVTTMERSRLPLEALMDRYGVGRRATVRAANVPVLALEDPTSSARERLCREIERALREDRAEAIVLGCAGMADLPRQLQVEYGIPVVDGVAAAVKQAECLVTLGLTTAKQGAYAFPLAKPYSGILAGFSPSDALST